MEFPNDKIISLNSLEAEINDKIVNQKSQCTSVFQLSESTSENSDTFQKKILHKPISSAFALKRSKDLRQSYYDQLISLQILPKDEQKRILHIQDGGGMLFGFVEKNNDKPIRFSSTLGNSVSVTEYNSFGWEVK